MADQIDHRYSGDAVHNEFASCDGVLTIDHERSDESKSENDALEPKLLSLSRNDMGEVLVVDVTANEVLQ